MGVLTNIKCIVKAEHLGGCMVSYDLHDVVSGRVVHASKLSEEQSFTYMDFLSALTEASREDTGYFMLTGELVQESDRGVWLNVAVSGGRMSWCPHTGATIDII